VGINKVVPEHPKLTIRKIDFLAGVKIDENLPLTGCLRSGSPKRIGLQARLFALFITLWYNIVSEDS
jgi:hypothetical protein